MTTEDQQFEELLTEARRTVEVDKDELAEARHRRTRLGEALTAAFPGGRLYPAGSIAHGDALDPLTDVDLGVVVPNTAGVYGPRGDGPRDLMEQARVAIRDTLADEYPRLRVTIEGQNHAVLVTFGDPVTRGQDEFSADVITAIDNPDDTGLFIPALKSPTGWERSNAERHTSLIRERNDLTKISFAHVVRLLKHWARTHDQPLCSWHIKVFALVALHEPVAQYDGMAAVFATALAQVTTSPTPDPTGVGPGVSINQPIAQVRRALADGADLLGQARAESDAGNLVAARKLLAELLPGAIEVPTAATDAGRSQLAARLAAGSATPLVGAATAPRPKVASRSWRP